jgi:uridine kinase
VTVETFIDNPEFEQKMFVETEQTYLPVFPEVIEAKYLEQARPIEQIYLSHPSEAFSLRLREDIDENGNLRYTAALKDRGSSTPDGLKRLEVEAVLTPELYAIYRTVENPVLRKLRATANNGVIIDFYENSAPHIESEDPIAWTAFSDATQTSFVNITGDMQARSEWKAHFEYRREHDGKEALVPLAELDVDAMVRDILISRRRDRPHFVQIAGRSGSGKSTIVRELREKLAEYNLTSDFISTDDYHRGDAWLRNHTGGKEWKNWDDPIVYDTTAMAKDLAMLADSRTIPRREVDFTIVESVMVGLLEPADVIIIEGIYASSAELAEYADSKYEMPTPLATSIGRRLLRDLRERPQFADPAKSLRYMLEFAEPMYRAQ